VSDESLLALIGSDGALGIAYTNGSTASQTRADARTPIVVHGASIS
jgi:hypothetical protein